MTRKHNSKSGAKEITMWSWAQLGGIHGRRVSQERSQNFLRGELKLWKQKLWKEKLLVIRIAKESTYFVDKQLTVLTSHHENWGSFQLNCHLLSLIFFRDDSKTRPPWSHVSSEFCFDLWFFSTVGKHISHVYVSFILQSLRNASNVSVRNWWYWRVWWDL